MLTIVANKFPLLENEIKFVLSIPRLKEQRATELKWRIKWQFGGILVKNKSHLIFASSLKLENFFFKVAFSIERSSHASTESANCNFPSEMINRALETCLIKIDLKFLRLDQPRVQKIFISLRLCEKMSSVFKTNSIIGKWQFFYFLGSLLSMQVGFPVNTIITGNKEV